MITVTPLDRLGAFRNDWLDAHYHFSFADYRDRDRMGLGALRVWNDDTIQPRTGFGPHPHRDMEIVTYVRSGAISHEDSLGNKGVTRAGDVQVMSAGSGIVHAEMNEEEEPTTLFQIWINTDARGLEPRGRRHRRRRRHHHRSAGRCRSGAGRRAALGRGRQNVPSSTPTLSLPHRAGGEI